METYDSFEAVTRGTQAIAAVGVFDGVHLGHQAIIRNAVEDARRLGIKAVVITFEPHPEEVLSPDPPQRLTGARLKLELLERLCPDIVLRVPFDREIAKMPAPEFIDLLRDLFDLKGVVVGANFHFGHKGQGTPGSLVEAGNRFGFEVDLVPLLQIDGEVVSSTLIRRLIGDGDIAGARNRLGRAPLFTGKVVAGHGRGKDLGFQTANLESPEPGAVPGDGVYAAVAWDGRDPDSRYAAALSIGPQPTFGGSERIVEVYLLDFGGGELYGHDIEVEVHAGLREQRRFKSSGELAEQIARDIADVRAIVSPT